MASQSADPGAAGQAGRTQAPKPTRREQPGAAGRSPEQQGSNRLSRRQPSEPLGSWGTSPFTFMRRMLEDMDRFVEDSMAGRFALPGGHEAQGGALWSPQVDVFERDGRLVVRADLPGLRKQDVRVEITDDMITIDGERHKEREVEESGVYRSERSYGSFYRAIPLPGGANVQGTEARFANGVLEIVVPLDERTTRKRIEIQDEQTQTKQAQQSPTQPSVH